MTFGKRTTRQPAGATMDTRKAHRGSIITRRTDAEYRVALSTTTTKARVRSRKISASKQSRAMDARGENGPATMTSVQRINLPEIRQEMMKMISCGRIYQTPPTRTWSRSVVMSIACEEAAADAAAEHAKSR